MDLESRLKGYHILFATVALTSITREHPQKKENHGEPSKETYWTTVGYWTTIVYWTTVPLTSITRVHPQRDEEHQEPEQRDAMHARSTYTSLTTFGC